VGLKGRLWKNELYKQKDGPNMTKPSFSMRKKIEMIVKAVDETIAERKGWEEEFEKLPSSLTFHIPKDVVKSFIKDLLASQREKVVEEISRDFETAIYLLEPSNKTATFVRRFREILKLELSKEGKQV